MEDELLERYSSIPNTISSLRRWVCFKIVDRDGKATKVPINAISGDFASVDNKLTWTDFDTAMAGCRKYGMSGIGFVLGNGIFGVDLDNHGEMAQEEFDAMADEFIEGLDSYTERSQSGKGIHIICYGKLPNAIGENGEEIRGRRRKGNVEMYDNGRFFAFTGDVIRNKPIEERTSEIIPLWKKYVDDIDDRKARAERQSYIPISSNYSGLPLSDAEVVDMAMKSSNGSLFSSLYNGDLSVAGNDHSRADLALCSYLAFWTNKDVGQIDRIFRSSSLMRDKWDSLRGSETYGQMTIRMACEGVGQNGYVRNISEAVDYGIDVGKPHTPVKQSTTQSYMNIGEDGEPVFRIKYSVGYNYSYDDVGNAERFYDYFGECFKYNVDYKCFMFWTGNTWVIDSKNIIRKYATKLIEILNDEVKQLRERMKAEEDEEKKKAAKAIYEKALKNKDRMSNKAGRDSMLAEFQSIGDISVHNSDFDVDPYMLNTLSGIVDLKTGRITSFDSRAMLSKNTNCEISFEEPEEWMKFVRSIFWRGDDEEKKRETEEIIDFVQQCLWYSLTGSTREQLMFMMYGSGSNGKTTFVEQMRKVMGDYGSSKESSILMANPNKGSSVQFSLAELVGCRFLITEETNEGEKMDEGGVKSLTGSGKISAQKKYGNPFEFLPQFKIWMLTNNLPIIRGADYGIWRRIVLIPFLHVFADSEKDMDMPEKLAKETDKILGWCVKGYEKYLKNGNRLVMPQCLKKALRGYQEDMDVVSKFINKCCRVYPHSSENCKEVFAAYKAWAMDNKEFILRESKFSDSMVSKGFKIGSSQKGDPCYEGISLLPSYKAVQQQGYRVTYDDE